MVFQLPKQITQILTVLAAAVILLLSALSGTSAGQKLAQSSAISANAVSVAEGLHYFYNDQDRFPSAIEFESDKNLMLNYFNTFPPADIPSGQCPQNFSYQRPTPITFKLNFCLPTKTNGFNSGWNQLTQ